MDLSTALLPEVPNINFDQALHGQGEMINLQDLELTSKIDLENEFFHACDPEGPIEFYDFTHNVKTLPRTTSFDVLAKSMTKIPPRGLIRKEIIKPGVGKPIEEGTMILIHYQFFFEGDEEPFDSTVKRKCPQKFIVRPGFTIEGLFHSLLTMNVQEASRFLIDYRLAFREIGFPPRVKPRADVLAEIELLKIIEVVVPENLSGEVVLSNKKVAQTLEEANKLMDIGKAQFARKAVPSCKKIFRDCIQLIDRQPCYDDNEQKDLLEMKRRALSNLAAVYSAMNQHEHVCKLCEDALNIDPQHKKSMLLYVRALTRLTNFAKSGSILRKALKLFPGDGEFLKELERLNTKKKEFDLLKEEKLAKKVAQVQIVIG